MKNLCDRCDGARLHEANRCNPAAALAACSVRSRPRRSWATRNGPASARFTNFVISAMAKIHVNESDKPEENPLTRRHMDFKPSWSKDLATCSSASAPGL